MILYLELQKFNVLKKISREEFANQEKEKRKFKKCLVSTNRKSKKKKKSKTIAEVVKISLNTEKFYFQGAKIHDQNCRKIDKLELFINISNSSKATQLKINRGTFCKIK